MEFFTRYKSLYAVKDYSAESLAEVLVTDMAVNGLFDILFSDPGSDLTSRAIQILSEWMGYSHKFSLVDRHESNGVESTSRDVLDRLRAMCADHRFERRWAQPRVLKLVQFFLNQEVSLETGAPSVPSLAR